MVSMGFASGLPEQSRSACLAEQTILQVGNGCNSWRPRRLTRQPASSLEFKLAWKRRGDKAVARESLVNCWDKVRLKVRFGNVAECSFSEACPDECCLPVHRQENKPSRRSS